MRQALRRHHAAEHQITILGERLFQLFEVRQPDRRSCRRVLVHDGLSDLRHFFFAP
jgi:hypothetical protein